MILLVALLVAFGPYLLIAFLLGFLWQTFSSGKAIIYQRADGPVAYWLVNAIAFALLLWAFALIAGL